MRMNQLRRDELEVVKAAARVAVDIYGRDDLYVHFLKDGRGNVYDISTPLTVEELTSGGYIEDYYSLDDIIAY